MQPPPRKVKHSVALKTIHAEQCTKLQQKHHHESELLEDLRNFSKQRSLIEKEYASALNKLAQQYLKKPFPPPSDLPKDDNDYKTIHIVWKTVLEETERVSRIRHQAADTYLQNISEPCKPLKNNKASAAKKGFDQLKAMQSELTMSLNDQLKSQKIYNDDEHVAHDARVKAHEAESKVKNKSTGIFTSLAKLQQQSAKLNTRREVCEVKSTASRNEYLLNIAAVNAHAMRYYKTELPLLIEMLDGDMYERVCDFFTLMATTELECCGVTQECFTRMLTDSTKISRQYNHACFLHHNNVFTETTQYHFEPQDKDTVASLSAEHNASATLDQEAKKWAMIIAKESRAIGRNTRKMQLLQAQGEVVVKPAENGHTGDKRPSSPIDTDTKLEEYKQNIRRAETAKIKAEARIEVLRAAGIEVDSWLTAAQADAEKEEEEEIAREMRNSISTSPTKSSIEEAPAMDVRPDSVTDGDSVVADNIHQGAPHDSTYINYQEEEEDFIEEAFVAAVEAQPQTIYPVRCNALFEFIASNSDELTIKEQEVIDVVGAGDGEGWVRARNLEGSEGFVPRNYILLPNDTASASSDDPNEVNVDPPDLAMSPTSMPSPQSSSVEQGSAYSATDFEVQEAAPTSLPTDENSSEDPPLSTGSSHDDASPSEKSIEDKTEPKQEVSDSGEHPVVETEPPVPDIEPPSAEGEPPVTDDAPIDGTPLNGETSLPDPPPMPDEPINGEPLIPDENPPVVDEEQSVEEPPVANGELGTGEDESLPLPEPPPDPALSDMTEPQVEGGQVESKQVVMADVHPDPDQNEPQKTITTDDVTTCEVSDQPQEQINGEGQFSEINATVEESTA